MTKKKPATYKYQRHVLTGAISGAIATLLCGLGVFRLIQIIIALFS